MEEELSGRLFLGIPINDEVRKRLKQNTWQSLSRYKKDRMAPAHNWHFTLAFLGQVKKSQMQTFENKLNSLDWGSSFRLGIKGYGAFPRMEEGRVLWLGISTGSDEMILLAEKLRESLDECLINYDKKPFVPHLTLCRMRVPRNLSRLSEDYKMKQELFFNADKFILYESLGGGQKYKELAEIRL